MTTGPGNLFAEFLDDYYAECDEHLASARQNILKLESNSGQALAASSIEELLRCFHSVKGLSAMVGIAEVTQMAHLMEEYLRDLQNVRLRPTSAGLEALITGIEAIERVNTANRKNTPVPDVSEAITLLKSSISHEPMEEVPGGKSSEFSEPYLWHFSFSPSSELAERGVNVTSVREKLREFGTLTHAAPRVSSNGGIAFDFDITSNLSHAEIEAAILPGMTFTAGEAQEVPAEPATEDLPADESAPTGGGSFVRVEMQKLDELMRLTGELVISRSHFDETLKSLEVRMPPADFRELQEVNARIERQLRAFREAVMNVRMVPIRQVFERMRFVVRGLERDLQKTVHLKISGQNTEIDKMIVDKMIDPLLHIVRNAVSHGIEKEGSLSIGARTAGEKVIIDIRDDGRGIDFDRVAAKAVALGMLPAGEAVNAANVLDIICAPGFSTRDDVDLTSGRGMGMAVVKSAIEELGGALTVETGTGIGTHFTITLPLTLVILDALLVYLDGYRIAVPQSGVREIVAVELSDMKSLENNSLIPYRGGALPVIPVADLLRFHDPDRRGQSVSPKRVHVLVVGSEAKPVGLAVDKVTGQREIVVRSITDPLLKIPGIIGATELGDGKPVLIVDAETLVRLGLQRKEMRA